MKNNKIKYLVSADSGATKCRACAANIDGSITGKGLSVHANIDVSGKLALEHILLANELAFKEAGISSAEMSSSAAGICIADLEIPKAKNIISIWQHPFGKMIFSHDMPIACLGAHQGKKGEILSIGTGITSCEINVYSFTVKGG